MAGDGLIFGMSYLIFEIARRMLAPTYLPTFPRIIPFFNIRVMAGDIRTIVAISYTVGVCSLRLQAMLRMRAGVRCSCLVQYWTLRPVWL